MSKSTKAEQVARAVKLSAAAFRAHITRCNVALKHAASRKARAELIARRSNLETKLSELVGA